MHRDINNKIYIYIYNYIDISLFVQKVHILTYISIQEIKKNKARGSSSAYLI